jgi:DNA-binding response OmpR family regulator
MNSGGHILIVDDEAKLRQMMARVLQRAGYEVTTAADAKEALELVSQHVFDLLYLDIRMPDMNGLELLKIIHADHPDLPVVLFTAQPDLNSAVEALRRGATDYLLKPLKSQTVISHTETILANKQKERQKRELLKQIDSLQKQIDTLQAEFNSLEGQEEAPADSKQEQVTVMDDRYVTRGALVLDLHTRRVSMSGNAADLPPTAFDYLLVLARHAPNVVDYQTLVSEAQGYETDTREAQELTRWHVHHIRQAIEPDSRNPIYVINVRGAGYRLVTV